MATKHVAVSFDAVSLDEDQTLSSLSMLSSLTQLTVRERFYYELAPHEEAFLLISIDTQTPTNVLCMLISF